MDSMTTSMMSLTMSADGGPMPEFVSLDPKYACTYCHKALNQPHQLPCGHRICRACIDVLFPEPTSKISCPSGEEDCEGDITRDSIYPDFSAHREMKRFPVRCLYQANGCGHTMPWMKYRDHIDQCRFKLHRCEHCREEVPFDQLQNHIDNQCPMVPCQCPHGCQLGPDGMLRSQLDEHLDQCPRRPRPCPLQIVGCEFIGNLEELERHKIGDSWSHMVLLAQPLPSRGAAPGDHSRAEQSFKNDIERLKSLQSRLEERINALTLATTSQSRPVTQQDLQPVLARVGNLEQARASASAPLTEEARQLIRVRDEEITRLRQRVQELDLRCQFLESAGYDGSLLWKIGNFTERLRDAKEGGVASLYSPPFHAGRYGYKMCARAYLNGDGIGKESHISLFFVLMQGDYDELLAWPFTAKVTLSLIDQSGGSKHFSESFRPDSRSSSFQRPTTPMNVASGCPAFISHENLLITGSDGQIYIKNDTIYFRIAVDMSEIRNL